MPKVQELREWLDTYNPNDELAWALWCIEDVQMAAKDWDPSIELSDKRAAEILNKVHHKQDASVGINWDVIREYIDELWE